MTDNVVSNKEEYSGTLRAVIKRIIARNIF